jgi:hypothetical protein
MNVETGWRPLGELLVSRGVVTQAELDQALAAQSGTSKRLGEIIVESGFASGAELAATLIEQLGVELARMEEPQGRRQTATLLDEFDLEPAESENPPTRPQLVHLRPRSADVSAGEAALRAELETVEHRLSTLQRALSAVVDMLAAIRAEAAGSAGVTADSPSGYGRQNRR